MNKIRHMYLGDVDAVVQVHLDAFPGFFLTFLGPAFLREFYKSVCENDSTINMVYDDGSILGFAVGTVHLSGFYKYLVRKYWWKFGLALLRPVIIKPSIILRLLRVLSFSQARTSSRSKNGTLMSLAVRKDCQGTGIGRQLVLSFLSQCSDLGLENVNLSTDADDNDRINRFYLKMGFTCVNTFTTPEGRRMNEYIINV